MSGPGARCQSGSLAPARRFELERGFHQGKCQDMCGLGPV